MKECFSKLINHKVFINVLLTFLPIFTKGANNWSYL